VFLLSRQTRRDILSVMNRAIASCAEKVLEGGSLDREEALFLCDVQLSDIHDLFYWSNSIRRNFVGDEVGLCTIVNARSGGCSEDCKFCSQSIHYETSAPRYELMEPSKILDAAEACSSIPSRFGIVTSGGCVESCEDMDSICETIQILRKKYPHLPICGSLGHLTDSLAQRLRQAGMSGFNHNLECSGRFFPEICTTHTYADRVNTVRMAKAAGFRVCSGGIFGMGESWEDRVDLAFALRELDVDSVPLNFLSPITGTPLADTKQLTAIDVLKIISLYRFVMPRKEIKVCGGREGHLRDLQSWMFFAGASATMAGNYLTTKGRAAEDDLRMIEDLGLTVKRALQ